jgi:hypothetical protein
MSTRKKQNARSVEPSGAPNCAWPVHVQPNSPMVIARRQRLFIVVKNDGPGSVVIGDLLGGGKEERLAPDQLIAMTTVGLDDVTIGTEKEEGATVAIQFFPLPK